MSHAFPIATRIEDALKPGVKVARTRAEAEALVPEHEIDSLATDWIDVTEEEAEAYLSSHAGEMAHPGISKNTKTMRATLSWL